MTHPAPTCIDLIENGFRFRLVSQFGEWSVITQRHDGTNPVGRDFQHKKYGADLVAAQADFDSRS